MSVNNRIKLANPIVIFFLVGLEEANGKGNAFLKHFITDAHTFIHQWVAAAMQCTDSPLGHH